MRPKPLHILGQAALGPYFHLTLAWPTDHAVPAPGQYLRLEEGGILWPMREVRDGRLEVLATTPPPAGARATLAGQALPSPVADLIILAQGLGLAPLIHLCEQLRATTSGRWLALYEPPLPLPFRPRPSRFLIQGMPAGVIAAIPLLEDWGIPSRLASPVSLPGAFEGGLEALIAHLPQTPETTILACGDAPFLARLRHAHSSLPQTQSLSLTP